METIRDYWIRFIKRILFETPTSHIEFSGHKFVQDIVLKIPGSAWNNPEIGYDTQSLGYAEGPAKIKQLTRVYFSQEEIDKAKAKMNEREDSDFTAVGVSMMAGQKSKKSQGHCMVALIVSKTLTDNKARVTVFYRTTEVICKFGADLIFLKTVVIPALLGDIQVDEVSFHFANAYFSPMFIPVIVPYLDDIPLFLEQVAINNERKVWKGCTWSIKIPIIRPDPDHYNFRSRKHMHQMGIRNYSNMSKKDLKAIKDYLESKGELEDKE